MQFAVILQLTEIQQLQIRTFTLSFKIRGL